MGEEISEWSPVTKSGDSRVNGILARQLVKGFFPKS
jgi:hypothetical protein